MPELLPDDVEIFRTTKVTVSISTQLYISKCFHFLVKPPFKLYFGIVKNYQCSILTLGGSKRTPGDLGHLKWSLIYFLDTFADKLANAGHV